jgi:hypothetical protein
LIGLEQKRLGSACSQAEAACPVRGPDDGFHRDAIAPYGWERGYICIRIPQGRVKIGVCRASPRNHRDRSDFNAFS